jgi:cytochrome c553
MSIRGLVLTLATAFWAPAAFAASPLALSCTGCHQPRIDSPSMPALDKLPPSSIAASLRRARDAPQFGSIMARFAAKLSDADIEDLARQLGKRSAQRVLPRW